MRTPGPSQLGRSLFVERSAGPDGKHLVFATVTSGDKARHLHSSSIALLNADGDSFGNYEVVAASTVQSCGDHTEAYANPMFSPDSKAGVLTRRLRKRK